MFNGFRKHHVSTLKPAPRSETGENCRFCVILKKREEPEVQWLHK